MHNRIALRLNNVKMFLFNIIRKMPLNNRNTPIDKHAFNEVFSDIIEVEKQNGNLLGAIIQFGGQTPINIAKKIEEYIPILGTSTKAIDLAEDRESFKKIISKLNLKQPKNGIAYNISEAVKIAKEIGYPIIIRPSYVLGGRAMEIVHDKSQLKKFINEAFKASEQNPILIDKFIDNAMDSIKNAIPKPSEFDVLRQIETGLKQTVANGQAQLSSRW